MATGLTTRPQLSSLRNGTRMAPASWGRGAQQPRLWEQFCAKSFISKTMFPGEQAVGRRVLVLSYCLSTLVPDAPSTEPGSKRCQKKGEDMGGAP